MKILAKKKEFKIICKIKHIWIVAVKRECMLNIYCN